MTEFDLSTITAGTNSPNELVATITDVNNPRQYWYQATIDTFPGSGFIYGTSLRLSEFTVGEKVTVFQCFFRYSGGEFGFAKRLEYGYGVAQIPHVSYEGILAQNPAGMALAWLRHKAYRYKMMFQPGIVTGLIQSGGNIVALLVKLRIRRTIAALPLQPSLRALAAYFQVGDGVLVTEWPTDYRCVAGWWQTARLVGGSIRITWDVDNVNFIKPFGGIVTTYATLPIYGAPVLRWFVFYVSDTQASSDYRKVVGLAYTTTHAYGFCYDLATKTLDYASSVAYDGIVEPFGGKAQGYGWNGIHPEASFTIDLGSGARASGLIKRLGVEYLPPYDTAVEAR